jgi:large subunit ribosomal protein L4
MEAVSLPIYSVEGKEIDSLNLNASVFDGTVNRRAIYQAVACFRANQRRGLAATKTRGEVSGGGIKPWRQKGTGRARVGSIRSPLWRHGGVTFGPHPRSFHYRLPAKIKSLALKSSLNAKLNEKSLLILDDLKLESAKTKSAAKVFLNLKLGLKTSGRGRVLLLLDKIEPGVFLALRNLSFLDVNLARDTHAYEILSHKKIVVTKEGLSTLSERLKR